MDTDNNNANADVHSLAGAYVLDAVSDAERADFERHLDQCEACTQEVAELREVATRLGAAAAAEPRPELKSAVLARIAQVRQLPPEGEAAVTELRRPARSRLALRLSSAAAAVLLVTTTVLGVLLVRERQELEDTRLRADSMISILLADDTQVRSGSSDTTSGRMTAVMSPSKDQMLLLADDLPEPPSSRDYQVWMVGEDTVRSAGLLRPQGGQAILEVSGIGATEQIAVTVEPDGGSAEPTTPPVMRMDLSG